MEPAAYWKNPDGSCSFKEAQIRCYFDDKRRSEQFAPLINGKLVLDVGCGAGGFLIHSESLVGRMDAVEPQPGVREFLTKQLKKTVHVYRSIQQAPCYEYDVVTMFH